MNALKLRWVNETGGDWIDGQEFSTIDNAKAAAGYAFADGDVDDEDIIQAWFVDGDEMIGTVAAAEWTAGDFNLEETAAAF